MSAETWHGTRTGYVHHRCSCEACRRANTQMHQYFVAKAALRGLPEDDSRHGTVSTYNNYLCRCPACRQAKSVDNARYRRLYRTTKPTN